MVLISRRLTARAAGKAKSFLRDRRGGVAVTFGLAFPAVAFLSLVAVDYSRASAVKTQLQDTLDAAALIVARSSVGAEDIDEVGDQAFAAQMGASVIKGLKPEDGRISNLTFTLTGNKITGSATGYVTPLVASVFLNGDMDIHASSEVMRPTNRLEIAMVLDTTGSMQGTKLANLITAAKNFITTLEDAAEASTLSNPVQISIVPFASTVRVAAPMSMMGYNDGQYSMTGLPHWLDGRARAIDASLDIFQNANGNGNSNARVDRFHMLQQMRLPWGGCVENRIAPYDIRDTEPKASQPETMYTPYFWPDEYDDGNSNSAYLNDYLADQSTSNTTPVWKTRQRYSGKYSVQNPIKTAAGATFIPHSLYGAPWQYGPNAACNMQMIKGLSTNFEELRNHVDGLVASGETNIPIGLAWGWNTLSPDGPYGVATEYDTPNVKKIIVLMTDGDNTMNDTISSSNGNNSYYHGYGYIWQLKLAGTTATSSTAERTARMNDRLVPPANNPNAESLCGNLRNRGIEVYTVGVGVSETSKGILTKCAYQPDYYYDVDSQGSNLNAAFASIAGRLDRLRIVK